MRSMLKTTGIGLLMLNDLLCKRGCIGALLNSFLLLYCMAMNDLSCRTKALAAICMQLSAECMAAGLAFCLLQANKLCSMAVIGPVHALIRMGAMDMYNMMPALSICAHSTHIHCKVEVWMRFAH